MYCDYIDMLFLILSENENLEIKYLIIYFLSVSTMAGKKTTMSKDKSHVPSTSAGEEEIDVKPDLSGNVLMH